MQRRDLLQTAAGALAVSASPASAAGGKMIVATLTYGRGIAGRQIPGQPLPDHGSREYDANTFHGGGYTRTHPQYYRDTAIQNFRAPELGDFISSKPCCLRPANAA